MSWHSLPEPVLQHIFNYLKRIDVYHSSLTCKHWYFASMDNFLWKRLFHRDFKLKQIMPIRSLPDEKISCSTVKT